MAIRNYARDVLALDDQELERFVHDWMASKTSTYTSTQRFAGTGDLGRDIVGFKSVKLHDGPWDNFQCKQLQKSLSEPDAIRELAKIIYHASRDAYTLPDRYVFISPRGVTRNVHSLICRPDQIRQRIIDTWDEFSAEHLIANSTVEMDDRILSFISKFDYSGLEALDAAKMLRDPDIGRTLVKWFGMDPGEAPRGTVPAEMQREEEPFISELLELYSERSGTKITSVEQVCSFIDIRTKG